MSNWNCTVAYYHNQFGPTLEGTLPGILPSALEQIIDDVIADNDIVTGINYKIPLEGQVSQGASGVIDVSQDVPDIDLNNCQIQFSYLEKPLSSADRAVVPRVWFEPDDPKYIRWNLDSTSNYSLDFHCFLMISVTQTPLSIIVPP